MLSKESIRDNNTNNSSMRGMIYKRMIYKIFGYLIRGISNLIYILLYIYIYIYIYTNFLYNLNVFNLN